MLYKFYPPERTEYFLNSLVRFTQPKNLNDPFECFPAIKDETIRRIIKESAPTEKHQTSISNLVGRNREQRREILKQIKKTSGREINEFQKDHVIEKFQKYHKDSAEEYFNSIGILSLSKKWNNPLMWSHYTNSHRGFCIGFNEEHNFFKDFQSEFGIGNINKVIYESNRPFLELSSNKDGNCISKKNMEILCTKSKDWEYEDEYRIIRRLNDPDLMVGDAFLYKIPHDAVAEVVIGLQADSKLQDEILKFCNQMNVSAHKVFQDKLLFSFDRKKIS